MGLSVASKTKISTNISNSAETIIRRAASQVDLIAHVEIGVKCYAKTSNRFSIFDSGR